MTALTQVQLDMIEQRRNLLAGDPIWFDGDDCGEEIRADLDALLAEVERVSDQLADAWLALDLIARDAGRIGVELQKAGLAAIANDVGSLAHVAAKTLRLQRAPGHQN